MKQLLKSMQEHLLARESLVLVTITASSGATPRGAGARMLVGRNGRICGTIGGGAVEYRSEQIAGEVLKEKISGQKAFSLTREDVQDLGMICGGDVKVFFHYISSDDQKNLAVVTEALRLIDLGEGLWLITDIVCGGEMTLYTHKFGVYGREVPQWILQDLPRQPTVLSRNEQSYCVEQINSSGKVYIFGCGHVSRELQPVLTHLGFRCIMMDDRPEFAQKDHFPTAEDVKRIDFQNISKYVTIGREDYVCVMTRGHASDTVIQAQVLENDPCYIGVIGSRKKAAGVRKTLKEAYGISEEKLSRITTPIGLDIDAETPAEIAISIAAQMIQVRADWKKR